MQLIKSKARVLAKNTMGFDGILKKIKGVSRAFITDSDKMPK